MATDSCINLIAAILVGGGTITLAVMTWKSIRNSNEQEKRRREEELSKERRDRDTIWLNDIIDWAVEVVRIGMPPMASAVLVGRTDEELDRRLILDSFGVLRNNFQAMIAKYLYVSRIDLAFGEKLQSSIATLDGYLRKQEEITFKCQKILIEKKLNEFDEAWNELINTWGELGKSAANVVDEAVIEKLNILNI